MYVYFCRWGGVCGNRSAAFVQLQLDHAKSTLTAACDLITAAINTIDTAHRTIISKPGASCGYDDFGDESGAGVTLCGGEDEVCLIEMADSFGGYGKCIKESEVKGKHAPCDGEKGIWKNWGGKFLCS
ncbi:unnamed protein product [Vitrella brassicaformis CCMP3155]|uniref:Uncharacterized protein n=1 Tax=Vitrella brassicaformis (strain CCMP3155) TaxID=1169540 RepID=A0A0G4EPG0_VITBC|nr:unnamed protein product [Vitrella brassicaformis CCMP3155]|eukprot:CEL99712.1 unnamed protein product [Vitrella brassicaformis CCMP3155]